MKDCFCLFAQKPSRVVPTIRLGHCLVVLVDKAAASRHSPLASYQTLHDLFGNKLIHEGLNFGSICCGLWWHWTMLIWLPPLLRLHWLSPVAHGFARPEIVAQDYCERYSLVMNTFRSESTLTRGGTCDASKSQLAPSSIENQPLRLDYRGRSSAMHIGFFFDR